MPHQIALSIYLRYFSSFGQFFSCWWWKWLWNFCKSLWNHYPPLLLPSAIWNQRSMLEKKLFPQLISSLLQVPIPLVHLYITKTTFDLSFLPCNQPKHPLKSHQILLILRIDISGILRIRASLEHQSIIRWFQS
jgi:hypothetical protein